VLRPSLARTELNTRLLKDLKVCRGNADLDVIRLSVVSAAAYASGDPHSFAARATAGSRVPDREFLLKLGADPNVRTKAGLTALNALEASSRRPELGFAQELVQGNR
jgi:hypothetical protein